MPVPTSPTASRNASRNASRAASLAALVALAALAACSEGPRPPTSSVATGATSAQATVATSLASTPAVRITDAKGKGVKNVLVRWRVTSGGGDVVNDSVRTAGNGEASSGGWTLGTQAGTQTLTATADGLPTVTFTAEAAPGAPARLAIAAGSGQRGTVGTALPVTPAVRVEDSYGNGVPGVTVTFVVASGGGTLAGAQAVTGASGVATSGAWTLGTRSGEQSLRASALTFTEGLFATADAGPATSITVVAGGAQDGATRAPTPVMPAVRVADQYGNLVVGAPVTFTPGAGSGSVSAGTVPTGAAGIASTVWTLGGAAQQSLTAAVSGLPPATFTANAFASDFDIQVRFVGEGGTPQQREAFAKAVVRWRRVLTADLHTTRLTAPAGECIDWAPALDETVNDLVIYARLTPIDGPGRVLGQAGPCYVNLSTRLTSMGVMEFDVDDLQAMMTEGTLDATVLHEVGHVLGIGTLWSYTRSLLTGRGTTDPYFTGVAARAQFAATGGGSYTGTPVPVENQGGQGTRDSHWRRTIFNNELMQGYAIPGPSPLSRVTAASLTDLGYPGVRLENADTFTFGLSSFYLSPARIVPLHDDIANVPLIEVSPDGRRRVVRPKRGN